MEKKIKVLNIISSLNPIYGGTSSSTVDLSLALAKKGFEVDVVTNDPIKSTYSNMELVKVYNLGQGLGNYNFSLKLFLWLKKNKFKYDKFIFHGIWQFNTLIARYLLKNNFYVFTHGQLDPYFATEILKKIKKQIYWYLIEKGNLKKSKAILLTNENERELQKKTFVNTSGLKKKIAKIGIVGTILNKNKSKEILAQIFPKLKNKKYLLFLGRFHKKKGCEILLNSFKKIISAKKDIYLLMVGPNNSYQNSLKILSKNLGLHNKVIWSDTLIKKQKWAVLKNAEAMVLSSHGENFGMSIAESLSMNVPVITTNKVNIHNILTKTKSGFISNNTEKSFYLSLKKFLSLNKKNKKIMKLNASKCFQKYFDIENNLQSITKILNEK